MDGPAKRIQAARVLWDKGYKEDAAALVLIATAGVSRSRYPRGWSDRAAFTAFIRDQIATITGGAAQTPLRVPRTTKLPGIRQTDNVPLEDIIYAVWRCVMIHEARWPTEVYLAETRSDSDYRTYIALPPDGRLGLPEEWLLGLAFAVENAVEILLPSILRFPVYCVFSGAVDVLGSNLFQMRNGETKVPRLNVRNQQAVPLFSDESTMEKFARYYDIPDISVGEFPNMESLARFVERGHVDERFIFNPTPGKTLLPSYSRESLLGSLSRQ